MGGMDRQACMRCFEIGTQKRGGYTGQDWTGLDKLSCRSSTLSHSRCFLIIRLVAVMGDLMLKLSLKKAGLGAMQMQLTFHRTESGDLADGVERLRRWRRAWRRPGRRAGRLPPQVIRPRVAEVGGVQPLREHGSQTQARMLSRQEVEVCQRKRAPR